MIRHKKLRIPQSYAEAFDILGDAQILESNFAYRFAAIAGLRNFLAHDYEKTDPELICGRIIDNLEDVDTYLQQVSESMELPFT